MSNLKKVQATVLEGKGCSQKLKDIKLRTTVIFFPQLFCLFLKRIPSVGHPSFAMTPEVPFPDLAAEVTSSG